MNRAICILWTISILGLITGCEGAPRDLYKKFPIMKEQMEWLKSYCEGDVQLKTRQRGPRASIHFECPISDLAVVSDLDSKLIGRGFSFAVQEQDTKTWCKDGISLHVASNQRLRASSYYPGSLCKPTKLPLSDLGGTR